MGTSLRFFARGRAGIGLAVLCLGMVVALGSLATGQVVDPNNPNNGNNGNLNLVAPYRSVGGIAINAQGLLENASVDLLGQLGQARRDAIGKIPADMNGLVPFRKISLRRLDAAIQKCLAEGKPVSSDIALLSGLQQIRYVFVYPEQQDIILVGPAEGWKVDRKGNLVGLTTGRPVMMLDDLLVAFRTARDSARTGITCSIDPDEGRVKQFETFMAAQRVMRDPELIKSGGEKAMGKQNITFTGVPETSHFASVLLAADYRMKRIAMAFEKSPLRTLPNFLQMMPPRGKMMPRWWLEPKYEGLLRDPDGVAWELRGSSVKCMTEEDFFTAAGHREHSGKANPLAQKWADLMTANYDELAVAEPIFGDLRNCMELAIVGALIAKERLVEKAGCTLPALYDAETLKVAELPAPKQVDSKISLLKKGTNWVISASGGVSIYSWGIADKAQKSDGPATARAKVVPGDSKQWWWN